MFKIDNRKSGIWKFWGKLNKTKRLGNTRISDWFVKWFWWIFFLLKLIIKWILIFYIGQRVQAKSVYDNYWYRGFIIDIVATEDEKYKYKVHTSKSYGTEWLSDTDVRDDPITLHSGIAWRTPVHEYIIDLRDNTYFTLESIRITHPNRTEYIPDIIIDYILKGKEIEDERPAKRMHHEPDDSIDEQEQPGKRQRIG